MGMLRKMRMSGIIAAKRHQIGGQTAASIASDFAARVSADGGVTESLDCMTARVQLLKNLGLWDKASAVWLPHGYKEQKLYAAKGGAGADFTISRNGTKTRKGPTYVEQVPYNLLQYSEQIDNASWINTNLTIGANAVNSPKGTLTADRLLETAINANHFIRQSWTKSIGVGTYTWSVSVKLIGRDWFWMQVGQVNKYQQWFNLTTQQLGTTVVTGGYSFTSATITPEANGFYKVSLTGSTDGVDGSAMFADFGSAVSDGAITFAGDITKGFYAWGAQLTEGTIIRDYFATTNRFNVPALDYTNDPCPAWSIEPAMTNLFLRSEEFNNGVWSRGTSGTITPDTTASPDSLSSADSFLESTTNAIHYNQQSVPKAASSLRYTATMYVKGIGRDWCAFQCDDGTNGVRTWYNLTTGIKGSSSSFGAGFTLNDYQMTPTANGFYRCQITVTTTTLTSIKLSIHTATADLVLVFVGDVTKGLYLYGAQLEQGQYATSYIPTTSATVTRIADTVSVLPGIRPAGLTEGALFIDVSTFSASTAKGNIRLENSSGNTVLFDFPAAVNQCRATITTSNVQQMNIICAGNPIVTGARYRLLINFAPNSVQVYTNGGMNGSDTIVDVPDVRNLLINAFSGYINQIVIFETKLSSAEAFALTTPE